jgi:hypothetical protein
MGALSDLKRLGAKDPVPATVSLLRDVVFFRADFAGILCIFPSRVTAARGAVLGLRRRSCVAGVGTLMRCVFGLANAGEDLGDAALDRGEAESSWGFVMGERDGWCCMASIVRKGDKSPVFVIDKTSSHFHVELVREWRLVGELGGNWPVDSLGGCGAGGPKGLGNMTVSLVRAATMTTVTVQNFRIRMANLQGVTFQLPVQRMLFFAGF